MKRNWVIRVVLAQEEIPSNVWFECLRYAHIIRKHRDDDSGMCFDILCPKSISDSKVWSQMNAERMQSFGINAVSAPEWKK